MRKLISLIVLVSIICIHTPSFALEDTDIPEIKKINEKIKTEDISFLDVITLNNYKNNEYVKLYKEYFDSIILIQNSKYKEAYTKLKLLLEKLGEDNYKDLQLEIYSQITELEEFYYDADSYYKIVLKYYELANELNSDEHIINASMHLAILNYQFYNDSEMYKYLNEVFTKSTVSDNYEGLAKYFYMLGILEFEYQNYENSQRYLDKSLSYLNLKKHHYLINSTKIKVERQYVKLELKRKNYEKVVEHLNISNNLIKNNDISNKYIQLYIEAKYLYEIENYELAKEKLEQSLKLYLNSNPLSETYPYHLTIKTLLSKVYYKLGEFKKASKYYFEIEEYSESDEVNNEYIDVNSQLEFHANIEIDSKLELLNKIEKEQKLKLKGQENQIKLLYLGSFLLLIIIILVFKEILIKSKNQKILYELSITDSLTKVYNRRKIIEILNEEAKLDSAVVLLDIDDFKKINDNYGHLFGDEVLFKVANELKKSIRECDYIGRYGGEEFLLILNGITKEESIIITERIRLNIEKMTFSKELSITVSMGVQMNQNYYSKSILLKNADELMYKAKKTGKNKVVYI